jgi:hypothetical protein
LSELLANDAFLHAAAYEIAPIPVDVADLGIDILDEEG